MDNRKRHLEKFFNLYADRFNTALKTETADIEATAASFSESFIAANPSGVLAGGNNEEFRKALSQGYAFYRSIGVNSMDITSLKTTLLDDLHEMTKVRWSCNYTKRDRTTGSVAFENIYFTQTRGNDTRIFAFITGDEQAALKECGLL